MAANAPRKILVTSALPYANGSLHLGHLLEQVQTDIWVRFQKSRGHDCTYVCADDAHGTAIMLTAEKLGITAQQQIDNIRQEHERDSAGFLIGFDNFHTTHSEENRFWCETIYQRLKDNDIKISPADHGVSLGLYFQDPDGNGVELFVDNYETEAESKGWMKTEAFAANPIGVRFDPEKLAERYEAGDPIEDLVKQGSA